MAVVERGDVRDGGDGAGAPAVRGHHRHVDGVGAHGTRNGTF